MAPPYGYGNLNLEDDDPLSLGSDVVSNFLSGSLSSGGGDSSFTSGIDPGLGGSGGLASLLGNNNNSSIWGPIIAAGAGLAKTGAGLYQNNAALGQSSAQWDAQFAYQQQRNQVTDSQFQQQLAQQLGIAQLNAGAMEKDTAMQVAAERNNTLANLYGNYMGDIGNQAKDDLTGYANLGDAISSPFTARRSLRY